MSGAALLHVMLLLASMTICSKLNSTSTYWLPAPCWKTRAQQGFKAPACELNKNVNNLQPCLVALEY